MTKSVRQIQAEREPEQVKPKDSQMFALNMLSANESALTQKLGELQAQINQIKLNIFTVLVEIEKEQALKLGCLAAGYQWNGQIFVKSIVSTEG